MSTLTHLLPDVRFAAPAATATVAAATAVIARRRSAAVHRRPSASEPAEADVADVADVADAIAVTCVESVRELSPAVWDGLVPRDAPHLRYGFLKAAEESGQGVSPRYLCARRRSDGALLGVAVAYRMPVDLLTLAPRSVRRGIGPIRSRLAPRFLFLDSLVAAPVVRNCSDNFYLDPALTDTERAEVAGALIDAMERRAAGSARLIVLFEFPEQAAAVMREPLTQRGYLEGPSLPGTHLDVRWDSLDGFMARMRKAFRRTVVKDRKMAAGITFEVIDDYSEIADEAWALYRNVLEKADQVFEELTPEFFRALGAFEQSRLVTARDTATGRLIGVEFLLCGDTVLQDLYTGLDYTCNADQRLYFNLLYPVIGYAGEHGFRSLSLGQTSYTFKARLGVTPFPTYLFAKHRSPMIHALLNRFKSALFTETHPTTYHVFKDDPAPDLTADGPD